MKPETNNELLNRIKQAKKDAIKEKANIKKELETLEEKRESGNLPAGYYEGKQKNLKARYGIKAVEALAMAKVENAIEIEITEKAIEQLEKRLQSLKNAKKEIEAAAAVDKMAVNGLSEFFEECDKLEQDKTKKLNKLAESLIK